MAAAALRHHCAIGVAPAPNLVHLAELLGVRVLSSGVPADQLESLSLWYGGRPYILLATDATAERRRWGMAHELGHLLLHRGSRHRPDGDGCERADDHFATELLLPADGLRRYGAGAIGDLASLIDLADRWGVAPTLLLARMRQLRLVDGPLLQVLAGETTERGMPTTGLQHEQSPTLTSALAHLRSRRITPRSIAAELGLRADDVVELLLGLTPALAMIDTGSPQRCHHEAPSLRLVTS
jgi:Zn-dependent peptidase ImmA (M78 family)